MLPMKGNESFQQLHCPQWRSGYVTKTITKNQILSLDLS